MSEPIISVSGLRGIVGDSLTLPVAMRYTAAFARHVGAGPLVVSRDGRATGPMLAAVIRATLCGLGRSVLYADVAATPTTGILIRRHEAAGGIQISASHNPPAYNGIKLFGPEGRVISAGTGEEVLNEYRRGKPSWERHDGIGADQVLNDTLSEHARCVLDTVDVPLIRAARVHVLLDSNHGAGSSLGRHLLAELGCEVTLLGGQPDGQFAHPPEPTAENLSGVGPRLVAADAAVGFCQDPDADRLALIDETGRYVGEEFTLAVCLQQVLRHRRGPVVTNCSTSRMSEDIARRFKVPLFRSKVGEAHVADMMVARGAVFGGEGNGGPIDPRVGLVRDSFVGMALVLEAMAQRQMALSALVAELPQYAIHKASVPLAPAAVDAAMDALSAQFSDAQADRLDGLRLDWSDRWLLVRGSNTEPIVRLVAEAPTLQDAAELCESAREILVGQ